MLRLGAAAMAASLFVQGCYAFDPWGGSVRTPRYESTREVRVGSSLGVRADVTPEAIEIAANATPQCRPAKFGTLVEHQSRAGSPSFWSHFSWFMFLAAAEAGSIALAADGGRNGTQDTAEFVIGLSSTSVTGGLLLMDLVSLLSEHPVVTPWFMPRYDFQDRSVTVGPTSKWTDETHACGSPEGAASVPLDVRVQFANSSRTILWQTRTEASGTVSLAVTRTIQAVARYCGTPRVEIGQRDGVSGDVDIGQPDAPRAPVRSATAVVVDVGGALDVPLDGIADGWSRQVATECHRAALDACVRPELPKAEAACEESCASRVDALRCVLGKRACLARAAGDAEEAICATLHTRCLGEEGVSFDALGTCVEACRRTTAERTCEKALYGR